MKLRFFKILVCLFIFPASIECLGQADDSEAGLKNPQPSDSTPNNPEKKSDNIYRFKSKTAWGLLNILIRNNPDNFIVEVKSESSASGWILKDSKTSKTLSMGGLNSVHQFKLQANQPFQDTCRLTVFLNSDREQVPVVINLSANQQDNPDVPSAETLDEFQENPDHPFHSMVKNLYDKAVEDFSKNDNLSAIEHLKKAEKLDQTQPQVQALLKKILSKTKNTSDHLLTEARKSFKKGNKEEALAKAMDYLAQNPEDEKALKFKEMIEENEPSPKNKKIIKIKNEPQEKTTKETKTLPPSKETIQAQSDQAYNLGLESYRKNDYSAAKKFWEQTLQIQPNHLLAQRNLQRLKDEHPDLP